MIEGSEWYPAVLVAGASAAFLLLSQVINPVFLTAVLLAVPFVALAYFRPLTGFLCYLVAIQVVDYFKRLLLAFGDPSPIEWYGILLLPDLMLFAVLLGVLAAGEKPSAVRVRGPKYQAVGWGLCLYAGWYTVRTAWTAAPMVNAIGKWKLIIPYFVCFYLGERLVSNTAALRSTLKVLAAAVGVASLYGIWQFFFGLTAFEQRWLFGGHTILVPETLLYGDGMSRAFSLYSDPVTFGSMLAIVGTLLLFSRRMFGPQWWNSWPMLALMGAALVATIVRAAWLLAFLGGIALLWTQWDAGAFRKSVVLIGLMGMAATAGWWAVSSAGNLDNPVLARAVVAGTYNSRTIGFQNTLAMGITRFVVGYGVATMPGSATDISGKAYPDTFIAHDYTSESLYELGWIGFGLFLFIIVRTLVGRSPNYLGPLGPALKFLVWSVPIIAMLFGGSILAVRPVTTLLWAGAGVLCASDVDRVKGSG
jgi:hypothetical protein